MLKRLTARILDSAAGFGGDRKGNIAIIGALVMPMLLMASGVAVNLAHLYNTRSNMLQNLDIALTSTTRDIIAKGMSKQDALDAMATYIAANGNAGMSEADLLKLITLDIDRSARTVKAQLKSDVPMPFAVFGLAESYPVVVDAASSYADRPIEVAMMLDVTGSMNETGTPLANGRRQTKLDNLKSAASQAVTDLLSRNVAGLQPRVKVALIPYSQGVNTGNLGKANWIEGGIIGQEPLGRDVLNLTVNKPIKDRLTSLLADPKQDRCTTERKVRANGRIVADLSDDAPGSAMVNRDSGLAKNACPTASVVPLTADEDSLLGEIKSFTGGGYTAGHIGIQWTRYLLSPKWGSFLRQEVDSAAVPAAYGSNATAVRKVAILLTDGEFNTQYAAGGTSASFAQSHCSAMKANIEVFTIGFMLDNKDAKATMAACASPDKSGGVKHYYEASNAAELQAAFDAITSNTEVIRLTN